MRAHQFLLFISIVLIGCHPKDTPIPTDLFTIVSSEQTNITFSNVILEGVDMNSMEYEYFYNEV